MCTANDEKQIFFEKTREVLPPTEGGGLTPPGGRGDPLLGGQFLG